MTDALPTTDDIAALVALRPRLILLRMGDHEHAYASDGTRTLTVRRESDGWSWRTRRHDQHGSDGLDSMAELDRLLTWVDAEPRTVATVRVHDHEMDPPVGKELTVLAIEGSGCVVVDWRGWRWPMLPEHVEVSS